MFNVEYEVREEGEVLVGDETLANNQIQLIHFISFIKLDFYDARLHCYYPQGKLFINKKYCDGQHFFLFNNCHSKAFSSQTAFPCSGHLMVLIGMEGRMDDAEKGMTRLSVSINRGWAVKSKPRIPVPSLFSSHFVHSPQ